MRRSRASQYLASANFNKASARPQSMIARMESVQRTDLCQLLVQLAADGGHVRQWLRLYITINGNLRRRRSSFDSPPRGSLQALHAIRWRMGGDTDSQHDRAARSGFGCKINQAIDRGNFAGDHRLTRAIVVCPRRPLLPVSMRIPIDTGQFDLHAASSASTAAMAPGFCSPACCIKRPRA